MGDLPHINTKTAPIRANKSPTWASFEMRYDCQRQLACEETQRLLDYLRSRNSKMRMTFREGMHCFEEKTK